MLKVKSKIPNKATISRTDERRPEKTITLVSVPALSAKSKNRKDFKM